MRIMNERLSFQQLILDQTDDPLLRLFSDVIGMVKRFEEITQRGKLYTQELDDLYLDLSQM